MNIAIDTSIFRRDRKLESSDILLLSKLSKLGLIKIHIPWIVLKESTSQNYIEVKGIIDKTIKELNALNNKGLSINEHFKFKKISKEIEKIDLQDSVNEHWNEFIKDSKAILHKIDDKHGESVMCSYFLGEEPFPVPKSRKDIPDAFIYQAMKTISSKFNETYIICADKNLRESCSKIPKVSGLKDFSELYGLPEYQIINKKYKKIEHFADELIILEDNIDEIKTKAEEDIWEEILNDIIIESPNIPDDNNEGRLIGIEKVSSVDIDKTKIQFIDDIFYIPIEAKGIFSIEYFLFKSDYYVYDGSRKIHITDSDWNKHYFLVEETFDVVFSFKYKIEKDKVDSLEFEAEDINFEEVNIIYEK